MKLLLALCLLCLTSFADEGSPPQPAGDKARFTVVSGTMDFGMGAVPVFIRMDTWTGQTWALQPVAMPERGVIHTWIPSHEIGSEIYAIAIKGMELRAKQ